MNQRKCRMFSVLNEEQPASWPHLPLRPLPAVRLAWDVSIKIAERNCLETLPYINRSVLKKRVACIGTVQNKGDWAQPNKHFAKQKWHLYRQKPCLPQLCVILLWGKVWKIYLPQGCTTEMVCSIPYFGCSVQWIRIESRYCRKSRTSLHQKQSPKEQLLNLLIDAQLNLTESKSTGYARWAKRQFTKHNVCQWFIIVKR